VLNTIILVTSITKLFNLIFPFNIPTFIDTLDINIEINIIIKDINLKDNPFKIKNRELVIEI
jgi:hypothetical protein